MTEEIGRDKEKIWICHFIECPCLFNEETKVWDNKPSLEDCLYCLSLELKDIKEGFNMSKIKEIKNIINLRDLKLSVLKLYADLNRTSLSQWQLFTKNKVVCGIQKISFEESDFLNYEVAIQSLKKEAERIRNEEISHQELQKLYPFNI